MNYFIKTISIYLAALLMTLSSSIALAANAVIDVLVVYTKNTADAYGGDPTTRINQIVQVTNQIYKDSSLNLELRLAKTLMVNYTDGNSAETALNDITFAKGSAFSAVAAAREQAKADMVIFYRQFKSVQGSCGLAWIGGQDTNGDFSHPMIKNYVYSHIAINSCGDFVTAHELGHNMGLKHSRKQDGSGGTFPYALGYGVVNQFATIMAYQTEFNVDYWSGKIYKFSSPELTCRNVPCGVNRTDPINGADARYTLSITAPQIANFYTVPAASSSSMSSKTSSSIVSSVSSSGASSKASMSSMSSKISSVSTNSKASSASAKSVSSSASIKTASSVANLSLSSSSNSVGVLSSKSSEKSSTKSSASSVKNSLSSTSSSKPAVTTFSRIADVAQYAGADWTKEVRREKALTLSQAQAIAAADPKITYFFIIKGGQMSLGSRGVFRTGDAVFFSGKPWYGSAAGLADAYEKVL